MSTTTPAQFQAGQKVRFIGERRYLDDPEPYSRGVVREVVRDVHFVEFRAGGLTAVYRDELEVAS